MTRAFGVIVLLALAGNVQGSMTTNAQGQNTLQLNGGRTSSVDYYVDGGVVNSGQANRLTNSIPSMGLRPRCCARRMRQLARSSTTSSSATCRSSIATPSLC